jgi:hypothetical protein
MIILTRCMTSRARRLFAVRAALDEGPFTTPLEPVCRLPMSVRFGARGVIPAGLTEGPLDLQ